MPYINRKIEYENQSDDEEQKEKDYLIYRHNPNYKPFRYCNPRQDELVDPTGYFFEKDFDSDEIVSGLLDQGYYRLCYYQKYYVVAFGINNVKFKVVSKDRQPNEINKKKIN